MKKYIPYLVILLLPVFFLCGYTFGRKSCVEKVVRNVYTFRDTVKYELPKPRSIAQIGVERVRLKVVHDTTEVPVPYEVERPDTAYVEVPYEVERPDTAYVEVPIERRSYQTDDYMLTIRGWRPELEFIAVYPKTTVDRTTATLVPKAKKVTWGFAAGPTVLYDGKWRAGLGGTLGVTVRF